MTSVLPCPSCGANVPVRSAALPYVTCSYCQTLILRDGEGLTEIGKTAILPFDVSPLQLGTSGSAGDFQFTIVGRVRWGWSDGSWNEWLLDCSDGKPRWLGEAMGVFLLTEECLELMEDAIVKGFAAGKTIPRGTLIQFGKEEFAASDIKGAKCLGSEGDLPIPTLAGRNMTSIDFRSPSGTALSLQRDETGSSAWIGFYLELDQLSPKNIRALEGWTTPAAMR